MKPKKINLSEDELARYHQRLNDARKYTRVEEREYDPDVDEGGDEE